jgi:leader peptidase (prepilin peptidase) / N-methyltransferase
LVGWRLMGQILDAPFAVQPQADLFGYGLVGAMGLLAFSWILVGLAVLDAEHFWIADAVTLPGIGLGIAYFVWKHELLTFGAGTSMSLWKAIGERLLSVLLAALLILLIRWTYKLIRHREGIGLGDAKLMAMLGAWLGLSGALLSFFIGVVLGALVALVVLALPSTRAKEAGDCKDNAAAPAWSLRKLPLGTFLCVGGIVSALWGQSILAAYLRWAGF